MVSKRSWNVAGKYSIPITAYKIKIPNLKSKFEIESKFEIPIQNPKFKIREHAHTNFEL